MSDVLWRRLRYMLTPQFDLYEHLGPKMYDRDVMEVGFGTGLGTLQLARSAKDVVAIETESDAVRFSERCFPMPNVHWLCWDVLRPLNHGVHDVVVMIEVLEHIGDWELALKNIRDALKPNGELYMSARNANADLRRNEIHEREWTAKELKQSLLKYFSSVTLLDYTLTHEYDDDTRVTPLIARCVK